MKTGATTLRVALLAFLRAELDSPTEARRVEATLERLGLSRDVILGDAADADELWALFVEYRGREALFEGLDLRRLHWSFVALSLEDLETRTFTCINHFEKRFGTRSPSAVAKHWNDAMEPNGVLQKLERGVTLEPPILIGDAGLRRLVILEGHNRLISYLRDSARVTFPIQAIVGSAADVTGWCQW